MGSPKGTLAARHGRPVAAHLTALIAAVVVPFVLYGALLLTEYADAERARYENNALEMSRRIAATVDRDLSRIIGALQVLAGAPAVVALDRAAVYPEAVRIAADLGVNVVMKDRDGQHLVNSTMPFDAPLVRSMTEADVVALAHMGPGVSNLFLGSTSGLQTVSIAVPIVRDGEAVGFVTTGLLPERIRSLIEGALESPLWTASVIDANQVYIARSGRPDMTATLAPADFRLDPEEPEGVVRGRNTAGVVAIAGMAISSVAPWRIGVGVPEALIAAPVRRSITLFAVAGVVAALLASAIGALFVRRLASPLRALADSAGRMASGGEVAPVHSQIEEVSAISDALVRSGRELDAANQARNEASLELRAFAETLEAQVRERTAKLEQAHSALLAEVAEREKIEDKLRQSQKMEAIGQLTGGVAHDFNNLLLVILSSLQMADKRLGRNEEAAARRSLEHALTAVTRASALTNRLLAFSRQQPLQPVPLDPAKLVGNMSELLRRSLRENITVATTVEEGIWPIHVDQGQLENAILNIALNARDAMPEGGRLTVAARNLTAEHGEQVQIALTDTGVGMTPTTLARAFDPFFTTKPHGAGTGLGLSQVYGFIRQSGGDVRIKSGLGLGTTVEMVLPRFAGEIEAAPERSGLRLVHSAGGATILLVEDDEAVRAVNVEALRELGYGVVEAASAAEALRQLDARADIELLFTDVVMPEFNGRRLAEEAQRRRPGLRVLFTTGYTPDAAVHHGVLEKGVELLRKPFTIEELAARLREILQRADDETAKRA